MRRIFAALVLFTLLDLTPAKNRESNSRPKSNSPFSWAASQFHGVTNTMLNPVNAVKRVLGSCDNVKAFSDYYAGGHKYVLMTYCKNTDEIHDCSLLGDRDLIAYMVGDKNATWSGTFSPSLFDSSTLPISNSTTEEMDNLIDKCFEVASSEHKKPSLSKVLPTLGSGPKLILKYATIFPGTKWCGAGDIAKNYDDLGIAKETDRCCREHDHAPESLARREKKNGIENKLLYTMTRCTHDQKFSQCLKDAGTLHAASVGTLFFNILKTKCFDKAIEQRSGKSNSFRDDSEETSTGSDKNIEANGNDDADDGATKSDADNGTGERWEVYDASLFVPNRSIPVKAINKFLYTIPGIGDLLTLFS